MSEFQILAHMEKPYTLCKKSVNFDAIDVKLDSRQHTVFSIFVLSNLFFNYRSFPISDIFSM